MHTPVLLDEVLKILDPRPGENYVDATVNGGGHAQAILERIGTNGKLLGIDKDCGLLDSLKDLKIKNLTLVCGSYANLKKILDKELFYPVNGIIADLGFSSYHLEQSQRGFSFLRDEPLDMRYDQKNNELNAEKIVNTWGEDAIENILREFGQERFAKRIAEGILRARSRSRISSTRQLVEIISRSVPRRAQAGRLNPATRTFQALRIAVNNELGELEGALPQFVNALALGGKIAIISFHSLEDRIVKNFFKEEGKKGIARLLTPKPVMATRAETAKNPRARSAKLRGIIKIR